MKYEIGKDLKNNLTKIAKYSEDLKYYKKRLKWCEEEFKAIDLNIKALMINEKTSIFDLEFFQRFYIEKEKEIKSLDNKIEALENKIEACEDDLEETIINKTISK